MAQRPIGFGVIGADHIHVYRMAEDMVAAGGVFKGWWTRNEPEPSARVFKAFPNASRLANYRTLLDDKSIDLILIGALPSERAGFAVESMRAGKDVMTDKPGATTLEDLATVRVTAARDRAVLVGGIQRTLLGTSHAQGGGDRRAGRDRAGSPHQRPRSAPGHPRPASPVVLPPGGAAGESWATSRLTRSTTSCISRGRASRALWPPASANFTRPDHPAFEDFGEVLLHGESASGYLRVDWLTPDGQEYSSDSRF